MNIWFPRRANQAFAAGPLTEVSVLDVNGIPACGAIECEFSAHQGLWG